MEWLLLLWPLSLFFLFRHVKNGYQVTYRKADLLYMMGWRFTEDQDLTMIKDGIRADLRLSVREILEDYRQKMRDG